MRWQLYHRKLLALAETNETLTASQQAVCQFLQQEIRDYQQRINLWGAPGVGNRLTEVQRGRFSGMCFGQARQRSFW